MLCKTIYNFTSLLHTEEFMVKIFWIQNLKAETEEISILNTDTFKVCIKNATQDFPVVQGIRIHLPMQGTRVRTLVQDDSTSLRATKPEPQLLSPSSRACEPQLLKPVCLEFMLVKRSRCREKPAHSNQEQPPSQPPRSQRKPVRSNKDQCNQN